MIKLIEEQSLSGFFLRTNVVLILKIYYRINILIIKFELYSIFM